MIELRFSGWFQCRLATDPDPYDETRGVSGYVHAYVGEPDLDRQITFKEPAFTRSLAPRIGVTVDQVIRDGQLVSDHPLLGAAVDLLESPKFEGRNGVIADDGMEPVYPFVLEIRKADFRLVRGVQPIDPEFPYTELFAAGVEGAPDEIRQATGISDLVQVWRQRRTQLRSQLATADADSKPGLQERITFLEQQLALQGGAARFFFARMRYDYVLGTPVTLTDPAGWLPEAAHPEPRGWPVRFWFGGWDADVLCGFARGVVSVEPPPEVQAVSGKRALVTDRRP